MPPVAKQRIADVPDPPPDSGTPPSGSTAVEQAIAEIKAKRIELYPQHEGLNDYHRLNLKPETDAQVVAMIEIYDRRVLLLRRAQAALEALMQDGHPTIDSKTVEQLVYADLTANKQTIDAALTKFEPNVATDLHLEAGTPEQKT